VTVEPDQARAGWRRLAPARRPGLVIFDCDGVLIDSELLCCQAEAACFAELGIDVPVATILTRYVGISLLAMVAELQREHALPADIADRLRSRTAAAMATELRAIDGIADVLADLPMPVCVASGSEPERLAYSLGLVGLAERFAPHVFSATQVARGKPAPDLFLFAAAQMGVAPTECTVIEDSVHGVHAATAAGMRALGFTGGSHCGPGHADRLRAAGAAAVFPDMRRLPGLLIAG
jgi:HAD superfamily hydrolase (TIGR01509 family)